MATIAEHIEAGILRPFRPAVLRPSEQVLGQILLTPDAEAFLEVRPAGGALGHYLDEIDVLRAMLERFVVGRGAGDFEALGKKRTGMGKFSAGKLRLAGWRQTEHTVVACIGYFRDEVRARFGSYEGVKELVVTERERLNLGPHYKGN